MSSMISCPIRSSPCTARRLGRKAMLAVLCTSALATSPVCAQTLAAENTNPQSTLDSQLVLALPAALQTGMSTGVGTGFLRRATADGLLSWGARASWSTATEYTRIDTGRNDDNPLRQ